MDRRRFLLTSLAGAFATPRRRPTTRWPDPPAPARFLLTSLACAFAIPLVARAQPTGKVSRIGFIVTGTPNETGHLIQAPNEGLRELGYVEGRNVVFERRFGEGRQDKLRSCGGACSTEGRRPRDRVEPSDRCCQASDRDHPGRHGGLEESRGARISSRALHGLAETSRGWPMMPIPKSSGRILSF